MSEAMTSVEIEDVLSSIRRLVSEDLRPAARPAAPATVARIEDKLLLTPALRVVPAPSTARSSLPRLHLGVETPRAEASALRPVEVPAEDFESETGDPYPSDTRVEWTDHGWALAPEAAPVIEPEPASAPDVQPAPEPEEVLAAFPEEADFIHVEEDWVDEAEAQVRAALEAASFRRAQPEEAPPVPPAQTAAEDLDLPEGVSEVVFDEQVLRDLVRDILREELRGALGERITRNVRKLVHAEVARLLTAQHLD